MHQIIYLAALFRLLNAFTTTDCTCCALQSSSPSPSLLSLVRFFESVIYFWRENRKVGRGPENRRAGGECSAVQRGTYMSKKGNVE